MRERATAIALLLALAGVAASVPLIPGDRELAFIRFKDHLYDNARLELERQVDAGDLSVGVVKPLSELYLQQADVDAAIVLFERYVARHPDDLTARRLLGRYYEYGQRPFDYLRNLEQIALREPSAANLRSLADLYSWMDEPDRQIETIGRLDEYGYSTRDDLVTLGTLRASRGDTEGAIAALDRAATRAMAPLDIASLELLTSLLVDVGRDADAISRIRSHAETATNVSHVVRLSRTFLGKGRGESAARLLDTIPATAAIRDDVLASLVQAEADAGRVDRGYARLRERKRRGSLPVALEPLLIDLALFRGDFDTAWNARQTLDWKAIEPRVLGGLLAAAHARGKTREVQTILREVGDRCLETGPVLAAQLALERRDLSAARKWVAVASPAIATTADDQVALAHVEHALGDSAAAVDRLLRYVRRGGGAAWAFDSLAQFAIEAGRSREALGDVDRSRTPGASRDVAWARLAAASGEDARLARWLATPAAARVPLQAVRDIAYLSFDSGANAAATAAVRMLPESRRTEADRRLVERVHALTAAPVAAVAMVAPASADSAAGGNTTIPGRPVLASPLAAPTEGSRAWWRLRGFDTRLQVAERRAAAFRLLELEGRSDAVAVFSALAEHEAPGGENAAMLLHLWGPRPGPAAFDWIEARARAASGAEQADWVAHLTMMGAAARALAVLTPVPSASDAARFGAWLEATRATGDRKTLAAAIVGAAEALAEPRQIEALGRLALAESLHDAAAAAYRRVLVLDADAPEAHRWLGLLATATNDLVTGREHLERYASLGGRDPEALLRYGELLASVGQIDPARRMFDTALAESTAAHATGLAERRVHAFLLAHTGRASEARQLLEGLVAENPNDSHLRADYVVWLLEESRHADAGRILGLR